MRLITAVNALGEEGLTGFMQVEITSPLMQEILRMRDVAKSNNLYKVCDWEYSPAWYEEMGDEEYEEGADFPKEMDENNRVRVDAVCLHVSQTRFWWNCVLKHSPILLEADQIVVDEVAAAVAQELKEEN